MNVADLADERHAWLDESFGSGSIDDLDLSRDLCAAEGRELIAALDSGDLSAIAQALAVVVRTAYGVAHKLGIPLDAVIGEVHRADMSGLSRFGVERHADGKIVKSPSYRPADVAGVLADARRRHESRRPE